MLHECLQHLLVRAGWGSKLMQSFWFFEVGRESPNSRITEEVIPGVSGALDLAENCHWG
jgi:hypothetical protein